MKRILFALLATVLVAGRVSAQPLDTGAITAGGADCSTAARCFIYALPNAAITSVTLQVTGTFTATLQFEGTSSVDVNNATWFAIATTKMSDGSLATSTTGTGQFALQNSGLTAIRVRCSSFSSGPANITAVRGYASLKLPPFSSANPVSPANGGTGLSSYAIGDLIVATGTTTLASLPDVATGQVMVSGGVGAAPSYSATPTGLTSVGFAGGSVQNGATANIIEQRNSTSGQTYRVYTSFTDGSNYIRFNLSSTDATNFDVNTSAAGSGGTGQALGLGTQGTRRFKIDQTGNFLAQLDNTYNFGASGANRVANIFLGAPSITQGVATGLTINDSGSVREQIYKITAASTAFVCAAVTCDLTIGTLPANTWVMNVTASLTQTFACASTCTTSTLSFVLGKGAGGAEYLASLDADAATGIFGDADAELGTLLTRATAIQGGTFTTGSQAVVLRLTSGTGNIGNGSATNLSQGSITIWITHRVLQ